jgi:anti-sigma factor RsiW
MTDLQCNEFVELVTDFLDDALDPDTRARFSRHLEGCPGCAPYIDQFRRAIRALAGLKQRGSGL